MADKKTVKRKTESTEKCHNETAILKQYEIAVNVHQNETGRFWTRFNIFIGIQFAGLLGLLSNLEILSENPSIFRYIMIFCAMLSTLLVVICLRGIMSARSLLRLISKVETKSANLFLVEEMEEIEPLPLYINFVIAFIIAIMFAFAWWFGFVQLVASEYVINIPLK